MLVLFFFRVTNMLLYERKVNEMTSFKRTVELTDAEKQQVSEMTGKIQLWLLEGKSLDYISGQLNLPPRMVLENMCETVYGFLNHVGGLRCYLKWLFHKR